MLPVLAPPERAGLQGAAAGRSITVRAFAFEGNRAIPSDALSAIAGPYTSRPLRFADLQRLRDELTRAYVDAGYVSSGAVIPEQTLDDGVVTIRLVEGVLGDVAIETDGRFDREYIASRLQPRDGSALNLGDLQARLQLLQQDPRIRSVAAEVRPGERRGESELHIRLHEVSPLRFELGLNNHRSPSLGATAARMGFHFDNPTGRGDGFALSYERSEGLDSVDARYEIPLTRWDTRLALHYGGDWAEVVDDDFDDLDIESRSASYGVTLSQPVFRTPSTQIEIWLTGEYRRSRSFLLGGGFSFAPGAEEGLSEVAAFRFGQSLTLRKPLQVLALRSTFSRGLDAFGATRNAGDTPDGRFLAWLGQAQWAGRLPWLDSTLVLRGDAQLTSSPLLGMEQFGVGGRFSVRGYRENQLVRDNALIGSAELRLPLPLPERFGSVELAPFVDVSRSWNKSRGEAGPHSIAGAGAGLLWQATQRFDVELYWARDLRDVDRVGERDLQDSGLHFSVRARWPE